MIDRPRNASDPHPEPNEDVAQTKAGAVSQPASTDVGESLIDRSAEKADPTV